MENVDFHEMKDAAKLKIYLFGTPKIELDDSPVTELKSTKARGILFYLATTGRTYTRVKLAALMWGETTESASRSNLRKALQQLRNHLGDYLTITRNTVAMAENAHYWVDVVNFNTALQPSSSDESIRGLVRATDLYQGDFLDGFLVRDAPEFENWWLAERASLRERMLDSLQTLADHYGARRNFDSAISLTRRFLEMEPWREEAHRRLMILLAQNGHRSAALAQYEICREMLVNELGIEPAQETAHLYEQIRTEAIASPLISIPLHPPHRPKDNLPHPLTAFIGRQEEMEKITALISDHRLITLVGSGGIGKTELCLRLGKTLLDTFSDGVWLVELAPITDPAFIPHTIASALGMWESSASSIADRLLEYLNSRQCLIILDNCEHLTTQAAQFAKTILQNCPDIKLLVTSREILGIPGERQFRLLPLSFPQGKSPPDFAEWHRYDAVAMFVNCVTAKSPDFQVTRNNIIPIVNICQQLDGIPLALELAAAQVNIFTVEQIAARLDDRFSLLSSGNRTALPRQQTLHASIEWGWELLSTSEKMTMMRLAVFVGEATLQAVDEICGGDGVVSSAVVNILGKLVNKSLVVVTQEQNQESRYRLLESIRQYAWSELVDAGFEIKICDRHLDYYNKLGNQAEKELTGPNQATWLKLLEREIGNIRAALNWALKTNTEKGLELATSLWRFWTHSYVIEGDTWLSRFLTDADQNRSAIRAKALWVQSRINFFSLQNFDRAQVLVEESLALYRELGNQQGIGRCLGLHGWGIGRNGILCFEESLTILRSIGDKLGLADVLILLGYYEWQNDNVRAMVYLDECIYLYRELEHLAGVADALDIIGQFEVWKGNFETARPLAEESLALRELLGLRGSGATFTLLGDIHFRQENYSQSRSYLESSLSISQQTGDKRELLWTLVRLGYVFLRMGEISQAQSIFIDCQKQFLEGDEFAGVIYSVEGLASLSIAQGNAEKAALLFSWADEMRLTLDDVRPPVEQMDVDKDIFIIRDVLGEKIYSKAITEGKTMTVERVSTIILEGENP